MKILYLVRHAKSDWGNDDLDDIDRPLNTRGYRDAHYMSHSMNEKKLLPDGLISSPAIRALSTALIFCRNFKMNPADISININLYETSVKHYTDIITQCDDQFKSIMIFAHNPTISDLANTLSFPFSENIPTCGIVGIAYNCKSWKHLTDTLGELTFYDFPKNHAEGVK